MVVVAALVWPSEVVVCQANCLRLERLKLDLWSVETYHEELRKIT